MLMTRAWKRGAAGFVTDGGLRDGHVLSQLPFPTYASTVTITTRAAWHHVADLQVPIGCAGVAVYPGDVLVADRDGVIVVPRQLAAELADPALEQEQLEAYVATKIRPGCRWPATTRPARRPPPSTRGCSPRPGRTARRRPGRGGRTMTGKHRVVVVGGGFGGLNVTRALADADVDVTVVDRTNHHLFQPLLYQVAAGILPPGLIAPALRSVIKKQRTPGRCWPTCTTSTWTRRVVRAHGPDGRNARAALRHPRGGGRGDALLLRQGRVRRVRPGHEDRRGRPYLRDRILSKFEMAELATDPGRAGRVADLRRHRRGPDRRRARRADRRARAHGAAAGLPLGGHPRGADHPAGGRPRCCRRSRPSCRSTRRSGWRRWASRSG
jgi:hypothetical protein